MLKHSKKILSLLALTGLSVNAAPLDSTPIYRKLMKDSAQSAQISPHAATGVARFVRLLPGVLQLKNKSNTPESISEAFFQDYGGIFGIKNLRTELYYTGTQKDSTGMSHVNFDQTYRGLKVFGAEIKAHVNEAGQLMVVNGTFIPDVTISPTPSMTASQAAARAIERVANRPEPDQKISTRKVIPSELRASENELMIYRTGLLRGVEGWNALAYAVTVTNGSDIQEQVMVDANSGAILERIPLIHPILHRRLYEKNQKNQVWNEGDDFPGSLSADQQSILEASKASYNFFANAFGRDSYDAKGAEMQSVNNDPRIFCPNANWNRETTNYCDGLANDDVVAHEWGHAYSQYTHNLIYLWQSGALNESYSDIWGETIDQMNMTSTDVDNPREDTGCADGKSTRWLLAEDSTSLGTLRDMWNPNCYNHPAKVSDKRYICSLANDGGGVHYNSGIPNHGYALLVDGGKYNDHTIPSIGNVKAAHIYWRAQQAYQVKTSGFADHADALQAACTDLIGQDLEGLSIGDPVGPSGMTISAEDCAAVQEMTLAVELRNPPEQCDFKPLLKPEPPKICDGTKKNPEVLFSDDFEAGMDQWTLSHESPNTKWKERDWMLASKLPQKRTGSALYGATPDIGQCGGDEDESSVMRAESPEVEVTSAAELRVSFDHYISSEYGFDGGNVEYSVNGAAYKLLPTSTFIYNAYNKKLEITDNTNPLKGQSSFTGTDGGVLTGSWGRSIVDLKSLKIKAGDKIRFRFNIGTDGCAGLDGWYVDDVTLVSCSKD